MARGFSSTLGVSTTDKVQSAAFTTPSTMSIAGWYLRNGLGGLNTGRLLNKEGVADAEFVWRTSNTGSAMRFTRQWTGNGIWEISDSEAVASGKWIHYVLAYAGSATTDDPVIYINGRLASSSFSSKTAPTGSIVSGSGSLDIGNSAASNREWDGLAGDQALWSGVLLTQVEARALYQGADPLTVRPQYLTEFISLRSGPPASLIRSQPVTTGTKYRGDRLALNDNTRFPFAGTVSGAQNLTPSLFTNSNAFYAATVAAGAVDLAPALFSNSNTFYAPTVSPGAVDLTPALFTNSNTFYATTASATYALTPGLFSNSNTFYAATVAAGAIDLTPALFSNTNSFYSATVSLDGASQDIAPALFTNSNAFYAATVSPGAVDISPALFSNSNTFYAPTVSASYTLAPVLFTNSNSFFSPTVQATYALIASIFGNTNTFYSPTVSAGAVDLAPSPLSNINTFYAPVVALDGQIIVVPLYTNTNAFYAAAVEIPISRLTGSRPTSGASRLRTNIQTGTRPAARG